MIYQQHAVSKHFQYIKLSSNFKQLSLAEAVQKNMRNTPRSIPQMFTYDYRGSQLFEEICLLPEYYQTRTEIEILRTIQSELPRYLPKRLRLVELGSGSSIKTKCILDSLPNMCAGTEYVPIDISDSMVDGAGSLLDDYPMLHITGIVDTYERGLSLVNRMPNLPNLIVFFGSSLGNMTIPEADSLLRTIRASMNKNDLLLLGLDMDKDAATLEAAYNDTRGITAKFNLNILHRLNRELNANFDISNFSHYSPYNKNKKRMDMYLKSKMDQTIDIPGANMVLHLKAGELIHTENSQKYTIPHIKSMAADANLKIQQIWRDPSKKFSVTLMSA